MNVVPRGQYESDQVTPIPVGAVTTSGITNPIWFESDVSVDAPTTDMASLRMERQLRTVPFTGTATASSTSHLLKETSLPSSRRGGNMVYDAKNSRLIFFGGFNGTTRFNEVWELSADSPYHRWHKLNPSGTPPSGRNLAAATYVRGTTSTAIDKAYMIVWGGAAPSDNNEMFALDITTPGSESWATVTQTNTPAVRSYLTHHMVTKPTGSATSDVYLFGGWGSSRTNDLLRCTFSVNTPTAVTWTTLKANGAVGSPSGRSGTGMVYDSVNNRLLLMGGYTGSVYLADIWQYSIFSNTFSQITPTGTAPAIRELHSVGYDVAHQRMIISGGWQGAATNARNDVIQLSTSAGSEAWTTIKANDTNNQGALAFSSGAAAVDTARNILFVACMSGYDTTNKYVYAFDLNNISSSAPMNSAAVADYMRARDAPAYVYDTARNEMLFINGYSAMADDTTIANGEHVSEIWAYSRANNTWRAAAKGPFVMAQNEGGLAIYDSLNDRIIYFGGLTGSAQKTNDVWQLKADEYGMYHATKLNPSGTKPPQRWLMAGCYDVDRQRMVIWGGQSTATVLSDAWALDLTMGAEAWTQLSPTGTAPTGSWQPAYALDTANKRLYIHAGATTFADTTYTSQLFYLDISSVNCAWINTNVTGGLTVRGASMVYDPTSQRLVCFGGFNGTAVNNTVRYANTSSFNSWTTQATSATPAARRSAGHMLIGNFFMLGCGRPVSGGWFSDLQELDLSVAPASWAWTAKTPAQYQSLAVPSSGMLAGGRYHWQAWVTAGAATSNMVAFGGNSETQADYIIAGGTSGQVKVYDGRWAPKPVKVWNGTAWQTKPAKIWDGVSWVETIY